MNDAPNFQSNVAERVVEALQVKLEASTPLALWRRNQQRTRRLIASICGRRPVRFGAPPGRGT